MSGVVVFTLEVESSCGDREAEGILELRADGRDFGSGDLEG
jgi:hypothetical protein